MAAHLPDLRSPDWQQQQILLVDDNAQNLKVLYETLSVMGHKLLVANSGLKALSMLKATSVDLILLDIMMPEMDGFEVCGRLKAHPEWKNIPVIFLSALDDLDAKLKGFEAGAVDYITKPFQSREVIARVATHLRLRHLEWQQALANARQQIEWQREQLAQVARLATLGEMAAGIAHEVNQPLTAILNYTSAAQRLLTKPAPDSSLLGEMLEKLDIQARRAGDVIQRVRTFARQPSGEATALNIADVVRDTVLFAEVDIRRLKGQVVTEVEANLPSIKLDSVQLQQVLLNLIRNALEATAEANGESPVILRVRRMGILLQIMVEDQGSGLRADIADIAEKLFSPFNTSKKDGMGIGLSLCHTLVQGQGGQLTYRPNQPRGCRFVIEFPLVTAT
ncbi:MAG: response regulator [Hahellaceae bacterium]|nr:response regulator [Hahellaceae bacterium]